MTECGEKGIFYGPTPKTLKNVKRAHNLSGICYTEYPESRIMHNQGPIM